MKLGYIHSSKEEQAQAMQVLKMTSESVALDELGIGRIRDAFADRMFPGFIRRYEGNFTYNHLYLESANATQNGFGRNVEFLLHLRFAPYKTSYDKFRRELIHNGKDCMFEPVTAVPADIEDQKSTSDELLLRQAIASIHQAEVK